MSDERLDIGKLIREAWAKGEPAGWFEEVYARAQNGAGFVPWAAMQADPLLMSWVEETQLNGAKKRAIVVGCGLGDDAEALAVLGFEVTAFDISPTAIAQCKARFPKRKVDYQVADLLKLPDTWTQRFDFVLENRTIQALPYDLYEQMMTNIAGLVARDGQLMVLCHGRSPEEEARGIPWALSRAELATFEASGLKETQFDEFKDGLRRFRVIYRRT